MPFQAKGSLKLSELIELINNCCVFDLEHPRKVRDPIFPGHWPGYVYTLYRRHEKGLEHRTSASGMIITPEHAGTHIDALCHQAEGMLMHGSVEVNAEIQTPTGFTALGVETVEPILRRGVLIDVATSYPEAISPRGLISSDVLQSTCKKQSTEVSPGDIVLIRTGYGAHWNDPDTYLVAPGMDGSAAEWLALKQPFAVGSDNVAWDLPGYVDPITNSTLPGHSILLVRNGIHIVENLFLEDLAKNNIYEFLFVALPLKFTGGTGSPIRPLAISIR